MMMMMVMMVMVMVMDRLVTGLICLEPWTACMYLDACLYTPFFLLVSGSNGICWFTLLLTVEHLSLSSFR